MKIITSLLGAVLQVAKLYAQEAPDQFAEAGAREENYTMRLTARVIDENGKSLVGFPIHIGIHNVNDYKDQYNDFRGKTNAEGKFSVEGMGRGLAKIEVKKDGYYVSQKTVTCYEGTPEQIRKTGKFFPWDPVVDVMVKQVGRPIPMIVRSGDRSKSWLKPKIEQIGKELRWDIVEGDWLPPHGKGKEADLILKFDSFYESESNKSAKVSIKFANSNDGLLPLRILRGKESLLKHPREAPIQGYATREIELSSKVSEDWRLNNNSPKAYFLRVRTQKNESGKVTSALYGKITVPFRLYPPVVRHRLPLLHFDYYLNPTPNSRNLEFDQINNLAPDAPKGGRWLP